LEALKSVFIPENMNCRDSLGNGRYRPHFSWVDTDVVLRSKTLGDALKEIRYNPQYNSNGDICNVEFTGEKYGCENVFFKALAPYVESGSYITFEGEDGDRWEWSFNDGEVEKITNKYRIEKIGFGYYVQEYCVVNFDGILDHDWKDVARFDDEERAREYIRMLKRQ
jgi:hypothetical protein